MDLDVLLASNIVFLVFGIIAHWASQRITAARRLAVRRKVEADAERILRGLRRVSKSAMESMGLRAARLASATYRPRHAAWDWENESVGAPLPRRIPGATLRRLLPPPPTREVFPAGGYRNSVYKPS